MKILLIGKNGQLARQLWRELATLGEVVVAAREGGDVRLDLMQPDTVPAVVQATAPQVIFNAAAWTAVDRAEEEAAAAHAVNAEAVGALAQAAARLGALLVHYSTDYVFDGNGSRPWREDDATAPQSVYGASKLAGERAVAASGCAHLIFRTAWVYDTEGQNFPRTIARLARTRETLGVVADQMGSPTWARHLAQASAQILARLGEDAAAWRAASGVYHLCGGGETSWHGFAEALLDALRARGEALAVKELRAIATSEYPTPAARPAYSVLDCERAATRFGVRLPHWREAFAQACESVPASSLLFG